MWRDHRLTGARAGRTTKFAWLDAIVPSTRASVTAVLESWSVLRVYNFAVAIEVSVLVNNLKRHKVVVDEGVGVRFVRHDRRHPKPPANA